MLHVPGHPLGETSLLDSMIVDSVRIRNANRQRNQYNNLSQDYDDLVKINQKNYDAAVRRKGQTEVLNARVAAFMHQTDLLKAELRKYCPNHPFLQVNGKNSAGYDITVLNDRHYEAFDAEMKNCGRNDAMQHRNIRISTFTPVQSKK